MDLVGAAEDIARYDFFILKDEGDMIAPNTEVTSEAYPKEAYMNRIRWIWSRKPEQVALSKEVRDFIIECTEELNEKYGCHIQFLGREAWKKLCRVAIAVAACVCSYDETGENLNITEEHVVWAKNFLVACYDNEVFKLKNYVEEERRYSNCDTTDAQVLQNIYNQNPALIRQMSMGTEFSQVQLKAISGLDNEAFGKVMNKLVEGCFVRIAEKIQPSAKFRSAMRYIENMNLKRV